MSELQPLPQSQPGSPPVQRISISGRPSMDAVSHSPKETSPNQPIEGFAVKSPTDGLDDIGFEELVCLSPVF